MSILLDHRVNVIPHSFLVVCEGYSDAKLITKLIEHAGITNCNVGCPSRTGGHGEGKDAVAPYLEAVRTSIDLGKAKLQGILVVADANGDPDKIFTAMAEALNRAGFHKPSKSFLIEGTPVRSAVFLIPGEGRNGTLEHVLWEAAVQKKPIIEGCVETFMKCMGDVLDSCSDNQRAKMKMSALVAASCKDNPWASSAMIWSDGGNPIPIDSSCFSHVSDFLVAFTS
jgi:hypothetical protein